ncbi:T9SS type A sorting domain-containing protein [Tenacibaculum amylolyticum]|uniref:T9SS type A sorting domain-containing protein n=1 Tax=Tenacibaculum amylolyticum TaxID=104269 RepID=UPI003893C55C
MKNYLIIIAMIYLGMLNHLSAQVTTSVSEIRVRNDDPNWNNETWARGEYYTFWGCDEEPGKEKGDRYVIIVEGIDANNEFNLQDFETVFGTTRQLLNSKGIEVVYVNFGDGADFIENNAALLQAVIRDINRKKEANFENVVVGVSMGGLVARMALTEMEHNFDPDEDPARKQHLTKLFLSVDSPHKGANVPVGLQFLIDDLSNVLNQGILNKNKNKGQINQAKAMISSRSRRLNNPAAKQMLLYYKGDKPHQWFRDLQAKMHDAYYPQKSTNIALTNGSLQYGLSDIVPGNSIWSVDQYLYEDKLIRRRIRLHIESNINAEPNGHGQVYRFRANMVWRQFRKDIILPGRLGGFDIKREFTGTFIPYSHLNGGTLGSQKGIQNEGFGRHSGNSGYHSFIPTLSSFGIQPNKYSLAFAQSQTESNWKKIIENNSPFDRIYYDDDVYQNFPRASYNAEHTFSINDVAKAPNGQLVGRYQDELTQILFEEMMLDEVRIQNRTFTHSNLFDNTAYFASASRIRISGDMPVHNDGNDWITDETGAVVFNPNASVNFKAGEYIDFTPGVTIRPKARVTAFIDKSLVACPLNNALPLAREVTAKEIEDEEVVEEEQEKNDMVILNEKNFIYPNPSKGQIGLRTNIKGKYRLYIMGLDGQLFHETTTEDTGIINVNFLSAGLYIAKIITGDKVMTQKIIIE